MSQKAYRAEQMDRAITWAKQHLADEKTQRGCLITLYRESYLGGFTVQELAQVLAKHFTVAFQQTSLPFVQPAPAFPKGGFEAHGFQCPSCGQGFQSQAALSAHGPKRCQKKQSR